jgi:hypothetical protein
MSIENKDSSGIDGQASGETAEQEVKSVSYDSHAKLLSEKKRLAKEFDLMKARLEEIENQKLEAEGDLKKQNENLRLKLKEKEDRLSGTVKTFADKAVKTQFQRTAEKFGCVDAEMAFRAVDLNDLDLDEDFNFDEKVLTAKIEELAKQKSYLFKKDVSAPRDRTPGINGPAAKSTDEMNTDEMWAELRKLKI